MTKILIAEDDAEIAMLEKDYLEISGFETEIVADGSKVLRTILDGSYVFVRLSKHHLCRMFPRYYGFTPIHYLRRKRIQESLRLLRETDLPAQEIAEGFDNLGYFGKVFRALMGMTPTEFRGKRNDLNVDSIKLLG